MNKKSLTPVKPAHYIPFTKEDILSAFVSQLGGDEINNAKTFFTLIKNQIHLEFHQTIEELDHHYAPLNPNISDSTKSKETDSSAFIEQLEYTLTKANYKALGQAELNEALDAESLFKIRSVSYTHLTLPTIYSV